MSGDAEQLARLRVAAETGHLPADLGRWALDRIAATSAEDRRTLRDELLREAAALMPGGSTWAKARALQSELLAIRRRQSSLTRARELLAEAVELAEPPTSHRQLLRILGDT